MFKTRLQGRFTKLFSFLDGAESQEFWMRDSPSGRGFTAGLLPVTRACADPWPLAFGAEVGQPERQGSDPPRWRRNTREGGRLLLLGVQSECRCCKVPRVGSRHTGLSIQRQSKLVSSQGQSTARKTLLTSSGNAKSYGYDHLMPATLRPSLPDFNARSSINSTTRCYRSSTHLQARP